MKRSCQLLLILLLLSLQLGAKHSDDFLLGTYSYIKNTFPFFYEQRETLSRHMQDMGYNSNIIETDLKDPDLAGLCDIMDRYGIDAWITDRGFSTDFANNSRYAITPLATSSYQRFEAEYLDERDVNPKDGMDSRFWYASRNDNRITRTGKAVKHDKASNGFVWKSQKGQDAAGLAYGDIRYRWPNVNGAYVRLGHEFHIYQKNHPNYEGDYIWITYRFKLSDIDSGIKATAPLLTFQASGFEIIDGSFASKATALQAVLDQGPLKEAVYTLADYQKAKSVDGFVDYVLKIPYKELLNSNLLKVPNQYLMILINLNPRLHWHGNCTLELDYIDIEDQISYELRKLEPRYKEGILKRAREIMKGKSNISGFYAFDEPFQGQFNSFRVLQELLAEAEIPLMTANYDFQHGNIILDKDKKISYNHLNAFLAEVQPRVFSPDIYPIHPEISFNPNVKKKPFLQDVLDDKLFPVYEAGIKHSQQDPDRKFYPIVQAFGRWAKGSPDHWTTWVMPPYATQKALLYLPLVYGADGVIHYRLQAFQTEDGYGDYVGLASHLKGGKYTSPEIAPITMDAILHSNPKVLLYGGIIRDLKWIDAQKIMTARASPNSIPSSALIKNIYVEKQAKAPYSGYIQCGYYLDEASTPYLMLVNRRGNYFQSAALTAEAHVHPAQYDSYFPQADPQTLHIEFDQAATSRFGDYIGLLDPETNRIISSKDLKSSITIPAGEARLLKMVQTLPDDAQGKIILKGETLLAHEVVLGKGSELILDKSGKLTLLPGARLIVPPHAAITLAGEIEVLGDAEIHIFGQITEEDLLIRKSEQAVVVKDPQPQRPFFKRLFGIK